MWADSTWFDRCERASYDARLSVYTLVVRAVGVLTRAEKDSVHLFCVVSTVFSCLAYTPFRPSNYGPRTTCPICWNLTILEWVLRWKIAKAETRMEDAPKQICGAMYISVQHGLEQWRFNEELNVWSSYSFHVDCFRAHSDKLSASSVGFDGIFEIFIFFWKLDDDCKSSRWRRVNVCAEVHCWISTYHTEQYRLSAAVSFRLLLISLYDIRSPGT